MRLIVLLVSAVAIDAFFPRIYENMIVILYDDHGTGIYRDI